MSYFAPQPYPYQQEYASAQPPPVLEELRSQDIELKVRQQPRQALLTPPRKERNRKPVDPPIVVQMKVSRRADSTQLFLHNPNLFAVANLENDQGQTVPGQCLIGNITSSLHRLKEVDSNGAWGKDGGFFVFGDISVTKLGKFQFRFSIFELRKVEACSLGSVTSELFEVVSPKDYLGLEESSFLTRAFVDQGVRLRLRKEQRATGSARARRESKVAQEQEERISPTDLVFKPDPSRPDRRTPPQDDSPRPAKRARQDLGPMYAGVSHSTRGWGAFNSADMHGWRGSGGGETSMAAFPPLSAETDISLMPRLSGSGPTTQQGMQMPLPPSQLSSARTSVDWSNRHHYQSALAATGLSSPPSSGSGSYENPVPRPHYAHQSLQQVDASSPARAGQQLSPTFHQPGLGPGQSQSTPYSPTYARHLEAQQRQPPEVATHVYQPPQYSAYAGQRDYHDRPAERQGIPPNRSFGLQTLASASEHHAFIDPPARVMPSTLGGTPHLGGTPIPVSPAPHTYPLAQPIPAYALPTSAGPTPGATHNPPQLQQGFRPDIVTSAPSYPFTGLQ